MLECVAQLTLHLYQHLISFKPLFLVPSYTEFVTQAEAQAEVLDYCFHSEQVIIYCRVLQDKYVLRANMQS